MNSTTDRELLITREFQAQRELVWEAWTDPKHLVHWWGPPGSTYTMHEMNVKTEVFGGLSCTSVTDMIFLTHRVQRSYQAGIFVV